MGRKLDRACVVPREIIEVLHDFKGITENVKINSYLVGVESDRYDNFYEHGFKCCECGLEATYAAVEKWTNDTKYHINLYGIAPNGKEMLFTKDHIYPRALGGLNHVNNYQVMCEKCNMRKKDNTNLTIEQAVKLGYTTPERAIVMNKIKEEKEKLKELEQLVNKQKGILSTLTYQKRQMLKVDAV